MKEMRYSESRKESKREKGLSAGTFRVFVQELAFICTAKIAICVHKPISPMKPLCRYVVGQKQSANDHAAFAVFLIQFINRP